MKDLFRREPAWSSTIFSHQGQIYSTTEIVVEEDEVVVIDRSDKPAPFNGLSAPFLVQIQFTNRCNLGCPHCYVNSGDALPTEMSLDALKDTLGRLRRFGVLQIQWSGGEVFTRKHFLKVVDYAAELGFEQSVLTNGFAIGKLDIDPAMLWEQFYMIQISIDAAEQHFDEWVCRKSAWEYITRAVDSLHEAKPSHANLSITTTIDSRNIGDLEKIAQFAHRKDVTWKLAKQVPHGRSPIADEHSNELIFEAYEVVKDIRERYDINLLHPFDKPPLLDSDLPAEWHSEQGARWFMYVSADGRVYPFPYLDGIEIFCAGNILDSSLEDMWYGEIFSEYRSVTRAETGCEGCELICHMWPRSFNYFRKGNLYETPPIHPGCPRERVV